jgi:hypothetical protein
VNLIAATDLLYPGQLDWTERLGNRCDPLRYVVWVDAGRWHPVGVQAPLGRGRGSETKSLPELAPRTALHLVAVRNGKEAG